MSIKNILAAPALTICIFFIFAGASLFLGDGKQPFVDVWWALGILMMYGVRYYLRGKLALLPLPRSIGIAWAALILYYIILTPFSDSAGYSITATIRLIEAFLVYVMFVTVSSEKTTGLFTRGILLVGVVATLASFVFLFIPSWASFLPPMNLLYATYGHNHLADLLLFVFPVAIGLVEKKRSVMRVGLLALFVVGMILTFARGAWILLTVYLFFLVVRSKNITIRKIGLFIAAATIAMFLLVSMVSIRGVPQKPSLLADGRWQYWQQAIEAIKERPLFGSGPGTFYLQSKRLQARPSSYSWFAHSFPLETIVEVGVVGAILLSLVLIASLRRARASPLFAPLCLILLYSFFEFNLNYASVWLLFWATMGLVTGIKSNRRTLSRWESTPIFVGGVLLILYYMLVVSSEVTAGFFRGNITLLLMAYNATRVVGLVQKPNVFLVPPSNTLKLTRALHKKNAEVQYSIGKLLESGDNEGTGYYYEVALDNDPHNMEYIHSYLIWLIKYGDNQNFGQKLEKVSLLIFSDKHSLKQIKEIQFSRSILMQFYPIKKLHELLTSSDIKEDLAKIYYILGLSVLREDPVLAKKLIQLARDAAPWWGYFHVELASVERYIFFDEMRARQTLIACQSYTDPAPLCKATLEAFKAMSPPGFFQENIRRIPIVIH